MIIYFKAIGILAAGALFASGAITEKENNPESSEQAKINEKLEKILKNQKEIMDKLRQNKQEKEIQQKILDDVETTRKQIEKFIADHS